MARTTTRLVLEVDDDVLATESITPLLRQQLEKIHRRYYLSLLPQCDRRFWMVTIVTFTFCSEG